MPCPVDPTTAANMVFNPQAGTSIGNMGIGLLGAANTLLKRKFRFLFGITFCTSTTQTQQQVGASFVKTASRPDITIEDTELNFLNEVSWIPGKAKWETITVTYYDAAGAANVGLFSWLASVYNFTNGCAFMSTKPQDYSGIASLVMLDGCGVPLEQWVLNNVWPTSIKFGEVDYSSSDIAEVELTLRYSQVQYQSFCGGVITPCACTSC
jgi:hypothetical protein